MTLRITSVERSCTWTDIPWLCPTWVRPGSQSVVQLTSAFPLNVLQNSH